MFEIGWTEILVIAIVALIVFPTKDLPRLLRTVGQLVGKARRMAGDMQSQFSQALREAEREADIADIKGSIQNANPLTDLKKTFNPVRSFGEDLKKSVVGPIPPKVADSVDNLAPADASLPAAEAPVEDLAPTEMPRPAEMPQKVVVEKAMEERASGAAASGGKDEGVA